MPLLVLRHAVWWLGDAGQGAHEMDAASQAPAAFVPGLGAADRDAADEDDFYIGIAQRAAPIDRTPFRSE